MTLLSGGRGEGNGEASIAITPRCLCNSIRETGLEISYLKLVTFYIFKRMLTKLHLVSYLALSSDIDSPFIEYLTTSSEISAR